MSNLGSRRAWEGLKDSRPAAYVGRNLDTIHTTVDLGW
jgi:hypothetical protein